MTDTDPTVSATPTCPPVMGWIFGYAVALIDRVKRAISFNDTRYLPSRFACAVKKNPPPARPSPAPRPPGRAAAPRPIATATSSAAGNTP